MLVLSGFSLRSSRPASQVFHAPELNDCATYCGLMGIREDLFLNSKTEAFSALSDNQSDPG
jgi:hypothetical protein